MSLDTSAAEPVELEDLRRFAVRVGRNPLHIQGAGGNVSFKDEALLWVKASGTRLMDAGDAACLAAVDLEAARDLARRGAADLKSAAREDLTPGLRPSIETAMHAVLPQAVVCHTHSVDVLAHVCRAGGSATLAQQLEAAGEPTAVIPYARPGSDLATGLLQALQQGVTDTFILENHGLVVCGDSVADVETRLARVDEIIALAPHDATPEGQPDLPAGWSWRNEAGFARLVQDTNLARHFGPEAFWPDHAVFLGPADPEGRWDIRPEGVCARTDLTDGEEAMLVALALVLERIPADGQLAPLPPGEAEALGNWEAEKHRRRLDQQASGR